MQPPAYFENKEKYIKDYHTKVSHHFIRDDLIRTYHSAQQGILIEELTKQLKHKDEIPDKNIFLVSFMRIQGRWLCSNLIFY